MQHGGGGELSVGAAAPTSGAASDAAGVPAAIADAAVSMRGVAVDVVWSPH